MINGRNLFKLNIILIFIAVVLTISCTNNPWILKDQGILKSIDLTGITKHVQIDNTVYTFHSIWYIPDKFTLGEKASVWWKDENDGIHNDGLWYITQP